jgi:hypothetical protein
MERIVAKLGVAKDEAFLDSFHPTAFVHRRLAEELARVLLPRIPAAASVSPP